MEGSPTRSYGYVQASRHRASYPTSNRTDYIQQTLFFISIKVKCSLICFTKTGPRIAMNSGLTRDVYMKLGLFS